MSAKVEVIELLESDSEENDEDEVVVIKTIQPSAFTQVASAGNGRRQQSDYPVIEREDRPCSKRFRYDSSKDENDSKLAARNIDNVFYQNGGIHTRLVKIDSDDADDAVVLPGILKPTRDWINLGNTEAIVQHIRQNDKWSCGYRNLQMMLSSVLPHLPADHTFYQKVPHRHDQVNIPSLRQIQRNIEQAWVEGFDPRGAAHYKQKLCGKQSWIGAVEVSSVLSFWGIDSAVVQFIQCRESRELLPRFIREYFCKSLQEWGCPFCCKREVEALSSAQRILEVASTTTYPSDSGRVCKCPSLPLYLQWEGHSVTVLGMEGLNDFVIFDPLKHDRPTKLSANKMIAKDTQVLLISSFRSLSSLEQQARKHAVAESKFVATAALDAVMKAMKKI